MENCINLRAHHLLCLPGYKGNAYSKTHSNSWDEVSVALKTNPDMQVKIIEGKDTLCKKCPNDGSNGSKCNEKTLNIVDEKVKQILDLKDNVIYKFSELTDKLKAVMTPEKHKEFCGSCQWRAKGFCNDTFEKKEPIPKPPDEDADDEFACAPV